MHMRMPLQSSLCSSLTISMVGTERGSAASSVIIVCQDQALQHNLCKFGAQCGGFVNFDAIEPQVQPLQ
jgi:hypothetical protein